MNQSKHDFVTPESLEKPTATNLFPTPQSVVDELHQNKRPGSSGRSPRKEELVRRKKASEERFRALVDSIHKSDDATLTPLHETSSKGQSRGSNKEKKKKKKKTGRTQHQTSADSATDATISRRRRESNDPDELEKKDSGETSGSGPWNIRNVVGDKVDSWITFDHDESDFSDSIHNSYHDNSSLMSSQVDFSTPASMLNRPSLAAQVDVSHLSNISQDSQRSSRRHPSLHRLVVMESETSHDIDSSPSRPKVKRRSSRRSNDPNRRRLSRSVSSSSTRSTNPTPSVIAAGVQQMAAKFDVDMSGTPTTMLREPQDVAQAEGIADDVGELPNQRTFPSEMRPSRSHRNKRINTTLIDSDLVATEDYPQKSPVSDDLGFDRIKSSIKSSKPTENRFDVATTLLQSARAPSHHELSRLRSSRTEIDRGSITREKKKTPVTEEIIDIREVSKEILTEDNAPMPSPKTIPQVPSDSEVFRGDLTDFYRKNYIASTRQDHSIVSYKRMDSETIARGVDPGETLVNPKEESDKARKCGFISSCRLTKLQWFLASGSVVLIAAVVGVAVFVAHSSNDGFESSPSTPQSFSEEEIYKMLAKHPSILETSLLNAETSQGKAYAWITKSDSFIHSNTLGIFQRFALATLYFAFDGDNWSEKELWLSSDSECTWFSSTTSPCDEDGVFVSLSLPNNKLVGEIPQEIALLSSLQSINLSGNSLFGEMPPTFPSLVYLSSINLDSNEYIGEFPEVLTMLTNLKVLSVSSNRITGVLPSSISKLTKIEVFSASANGLTSSFPLGFTAMTALRELHLEFNQFSGQVLNVLGLLNSLEYVDLDYNKFDRDMPTEIGLLTNLRSFSCNDCALSGQLPTEIGQLNQLETLIVSISQLDGAIPTEITSATNLRLIDLSSNSFAGTIPSQLGALSDIIALDFSNNLLSGTIPKSLASINTFGFTLHMESNQLIGTIPEEVCSLLNESKSVLFLNGTGVIPCACVPCHTIRN